MKSARRAALMREFEIIDRLEPEIRALVNEYQMSVVCAAMEMTKSRDPEVLLKFCEANQRAAQKKYEDSISKMDFSGLKNGLKASMGIVKAATAQ